MDLQALWLTLRLATTTTLVLLLAGIPLAWWIVHTRARWRPLVEAATTLPLLLPPTVLGFYLLVLLGPATAFGRATTHLLGHPIAFTFSGLVIGSVLYVSPSPSNPSPQDFAPSTQPSSNKPNSSAPAPSASSPASCSHSPPTPSSPPPPSASPTPSVNSASSS